MGLLVDLVLRSGVKSRSLLENFFGIISLGRGTCKG
jgi:hypothetical protein